MKKIFNIFRKKTAGPSSKDVSRIEENVNQAEIARAKRLEELYSEFKNGDVSWETIQEYIAELNYELKTEILNVVEKKIAGTDPAGMDNAFEVLLSLVAAGDKDISDKGKELAKNAATYSSDPSNILEGQEEDITGPLNMSSLIQLARMADAKTGSLDHSTGVAQISYEIALHLEDSNMDPTLAKKVGLVHDIGYLEIEESLFKKDSELSHKEFDAIKKHTERGIKLLEHANPQKIYSDGILYHHERLDGSGYPEGLKGDEIPNIAKIIAVADFFNAVTSPRPHREALTTQDCLEMMDKLSGRHFDLKLIDILKLMYNP